MTINGQPVSRSEFEYSYNKNNAEGVIDKKSIADYVDLFINYKLKVQAALDARLDTLSSFKQEFLTYRDQQIRPSFLTNSDIEKAARDIYQETKKSIEANGGLWRCAHILVGLNQRATKEDELKAKVLADSIYNALQHGANFGELAKKYSADRESAQNGGELPLLQKGQTVQEFEHAMLALKPGEMSKPTLSPYGYHIIKMIGHEGLAPYDSLVQQAGKGVTREQLLDKQLAELEEKDANLKNLIREYYDGLLMVEMSNRMVWDKASADVTGLENYFHKHRKQYKWTEPRFKGIAYHVKNQADVEAVKDCVKRLPFAQWNDALRKTFNADSTLRIRVEKGIFRKGDNDLVDKQVFGMSVPVKEMKNFPIGATYGKKLKAPESLDDVRALVVSDYQKELEKKWVDSLRKKYKVVVDKAVLSTVNKH